VRKLVDRLWQDNKGQDLTEYALVLVLVALAAAAAMRAVGNAVSRVFANASGSLS
jgi:Flp pilus assembly pilin Flp